MKYEHKPVLLAEVVEMFHHVPSGLVIDATLGGGGHARALLEDRDDIRLLGIDRDSEAIAAAQGELADFSDRVQVVQSAFDEIANFAKGNEGKVMGILFDLGVSSHQLDDPARGFSYRNDAPLDMRMDARQPVTAADVVNEYDETDLAQILSEFGEDRFARRIAAAIVANRPLHTTFELAEVARKAYPGWASRRKDPARRTFQAIRMEVNRELPTLAKALDESVSLLSSEGGRIAVISYHSLEDRLVKESFRDWAQPNESPMPIPAPYEARRPRVRILSRRPIGPTQQEIENNPRSRSAKLRGAERIA